MVDLFNNEATGFRWTITEPGSTTPVDVSGFGLRMQLRRSAPSLVVAVDLWSEHDEFDRTGDAEGVVVCVISAEKAARLVGDYEADLVVTPPNGEPIRLWGDKLTFTQGVTR